MTKEEKLENLDYHETSQDGLWIKDAPIGCLYIDVVKNESYIYIEGDFYNDAEIEEILKNLKRVKKDYNEIME